MGRGPTKAVKDAQQYLKMYPDTDVKTLSLKFGIDTSTIYRAPWWINRKAAALATQQSEGE